MLAVFRDLVRAAYASSYRVDIPEMFKIIIIIIIIIIKCYNF